MDDSEDDGDEVEDGDEEEGEEEARLMRCVLALVE